MSYDQVKCMMMLFANHPSVTLFNVILLSGRISICAAIHWNLWWTGQETLDD